MENHESFPAQETEAGQPEHYATSLELKELASMFAETRADEEAVLRVIEACLLEPIPDLNDQAAIEEYNAKMAVIKQMASDYLARSEAIRELWRKIEAKTVSGTEG